MACGERVQGAGARRGDAHVRRHAAVGIDFLRRERQDGLVQLGGGRGFESAQEEPHVGCHLIDVAVGGHDQQHDFPAGVARGRGRSEQGFGRGGEPGHTTAQRAEPRAGCGGPKEFLELQRRHAVSSVRRAVGPSHRVYSSSVASCRFIRHVGTCAGRRPLRAVVPRSRLGKPANHTLPGSIADLAWGPPAPRTVLALAVRFASITIGLLAGPASRLPGVAAGAESRRDSRIATRAGDTRRSRTESSGYVLCFSLSTMFVVEWPCASGTRMTTPPRASTMSRPTI